MRLARLDAALRAVHRCVNRAAMGGTDFHIVYGPNEAGKTTSLTAIEDMLFGIPERSPYNFQHSYEAMRVGGVLGKRG